MLVGVGKAWLLLTSADCKYFECHIKLHVGSVSTRQGGGGRGDVLSHTLFSGALYKWITRFSSPKVSRTKDLTPGALGRSQNSTNSKCLMKLILVFMMAYLFQFCFRNSVHHSQKCTHPRATLCDKNAGFLQGTLLMRSLRGQGQEAVTISPSSR